MNRHVLTLGVGALLAVACAGGGASPSPVVVPTAPAATASPAPIPTTAATPTSEPTHIPTAAATTPPVSPVELLIGYADPELQESCAERDQIYDTELASVTCGPEDLPFDYSLFSTVEDMQAAYDDDVAGAETPPEPDGSCPEGNYEAEYAFEDGRSGRINCREHVGQTGALYHVLEWTEVNTHVIGYISNRADIHSWEELYNFFVDRAGPYPNV